MFLVGMTAFSRTILRGLVTNGEESACVFVASAICGLVVGGIFVMLSMRGKDVGTNGQFLGLLLLVSTVFLFLPLVQPSNRILLLSVVDGSFFLIHLLALMICGDIASARHQSATPFVLFVEGTVYLCSSCAEAICWHVLSLQTDDVVRFVMPSLVIVYVAMVAMAGLNYLGMHEPTLERTVSIVLTVPEDSIRRNPELTEKYHITSREMDVLICLLSGRNAAGIADVLYLSENTVRTHLKNIYRKLGVHSKEELHYLVESLITKRR